MAYFNIPLTPSEKELIESLEKSFDYLCDLDSKMLNLLESKINSSNADYQNVLDRFTRHRENLSRFSKERSEILSEILIKRRTI
jgi:hypothetical protein